MTLLELKLMYARFKESLYSGRKLVVFESDDNRRITHRVCWHWAAETSDGPSFEITRTKIDYQGEV